MTSLPLLESLAGLLTEDQHSVLDQVRKPSTLISGPAGTGKTRIAIAHLLRLIAEGVPAESILVLVPQRSLATPYYQLIQSPQFPSGGKPAILTIGGLAQRMDSLFWPLIKKQAGFRNPTSEPRFLTIETAQYYLSTILNPLLEQGYFQNLTIDPNRLGSQLIDNLNKSATVGFPLDLIAERLSAAWGGKDPRASTYDQAQECALRFRELCLQNNLLDFSLQLSLFCDKLWPSLICRQFLQKSYRHLLYDNIEEDYPVAHDIIREWLPYFESALLIEDSNAGFRTFLGADPVSGYELGQCCSQKLEIVHSLVQSTGITTFESALQESIQEHKVLTPINQDILESFSILSFRFYIEAIQWIIIQIKQLLQSDVRPGEIAILSPYLSDALRFSLSSQMEKEGIPYLTFHPYRALKDEPVVQALITFLKTAGQSSKKKPSREEMRNAIFQILGNCDLVRADLIAQVLYKPGSESPWLNPFEKLNGDMQERITFLLGERYDQVRTWLQENPLTNNGIDYWCSRLFGEILSQPEFGLHNDFPNAAVVTRFIDSYRKFRDVVLSDSVNPDLDVNQEFIAVLESGTLAAQSIEAVRSQAGQDAVILAPAYTYLVNNRPVRYQFWLDIGSQGWWSRLDQPLTQPYVLNRNWNPATNGQTAMNTQPIKEY